MLYFTAPQTIEELKAQYRKLVLQYHPDRGGKDEIMSAINREYNYYLRRVSHIHQTQTGKTYESKARADRFTCDINDLDDGFREVLLKLLRIKDIEVLLVGEWIWISGDTKKNKNAIKAAGCKWSAPRARWYWHKPDGKHYRRSKGSFSDICAKYGRREFKPEEI